MYCNYSKEKFGNELTFIKPNWVTLEEGVNENIPDNIFKNAMIDVEKSYLRLLEQGWKPQQARAILPNSLKTEINMCGFTSDWKHFFELRDSEKAHPDMQALVAQLHEEFINRGYIK